MDTRIYLFYVSCFMWFSLTGFSFELSAIITGLCVAMIVVLLVHKSDIYGTSVENGFWQFASSNSPNLCSIYLPKDKIFWSRSVNYIKWLLKEVFNSALQVSKIAWRKNMFFRPVLEKIKAKQDHDIGVVIYANSITITPGTVTIANQDNDLLVHALDISFMDDLKTGQMERKVKKIIRPN